MLNFLMYTMEYRLEKLRQSEEIERNREANTSKNAESINISKTFLKILKSSFEVKILYGDKNSFKRGKKIKSAIEVKMKNLFQNVTTSTETGFDDIIALAVAYYNLGELHLEDIKLEVAEDNFMRCIELLNGKELDCKAILTAIRVHLQLYYVWIKIKKLEKCFPLLDKAMELYLNYTKEDEDEYPYPIEIATVLHIQNITLNSKIVLADLHTITLKLLMEQYKLKPIDKHKFVIYVHNLLNKELIEGLKTDSTISIFWANTAADLCLYFVHHDLFIEARDHLGAADCMMEIYFNTMCEKQNTSNLRAEINDYELFCANIAILWGKYGVFLLRSSIENLPQYDKSCEANNIKLKSLAKSKEELTKSLTFIDLKKNLEHIEIPATYVSNLNDAKRIFSHILKTFNLAKKYYTVDKNIFCYMDIILHISAAYEYYAYFVDDDINKLKLIKQCIKILENAVSNVVIKCKTLEEYQLVKKFYFKLAICYSTLLNMTSEKFNDIEEITDEMRMETKQLVKNIVDNFTLYLKST
ncbi:protein KBP homolog [Nylanderia fulva]|uniref:protein KBP homolog n=1 Tax=Nylanderia fulva TaxID=613905 RepID=UPI0010FAD040|nr:protein KBP homolog [Nylanderia fulva]XP_029158116.1 protein KBP homolog [Nylanderia fulva]XP_029158117.1 protein KBP homolog [Nylanderia fulva]